jgi:hypothetical protein
VLRKPTEHGLKEGVWYAADADEHMTDEFGLHTLAGVLGCGPDALATLQNALAARGLFDKSAPKNSSGVALTSRLGIVCYRPEERGDHFWNGVRYAWIAFGRKPRYSPARQLSGLSEDQRPASISPRTRLLQTALMPYLPVSLTPHQPPQRDTGAVPDAAVASVRLPTGAGGSPRRETAPPSAQEADPADGMAVDEESAQARDGEMAGSAERARALQFAKDCVAAAAKAERAAAAAAVKAVEAQERSREAAAAYRALLGEGEGGEEAGGAEAEHTTVDVHRLWTAMRAAGVQLPPLSERALERDFSRPADEWPPPPRSKVRADLLGVLTGALKGVAQWLTPKRGGGGERGRGGDANTSPRAAA